MAERINLDPQRRRELEGLAQRLGYSFKNLELLDQALRHSSYTYENPGSGVSNERFEFLGDAVLGLTASTFLLARLPLSSEGELSRARASLVNARQLASIARRLDLGNHLLLGRTERLQEGKNKPSLLANALEAVLAAIFLDGGLEVVQNLTDSWFIPLLETALPGQDYKTLLQERIQAKYKILPSYHLLTESGPGHARHFQVEVRLNELVLAQGEGRSKKQAAQRAARLALEYLELTESEAEGSDAGT